MDVKTFERAKQIMQEIDFVRSGLLHCKEDHDIGLWIELVPEQVYAHFRKTAESWIENRILLLEQEMKELR